MKEQTNEREVRRPGSSDKQVHVEHINAKGKVVSPKKQKKQKKQKNR